jgi:hypothetical protein
VPAWMAAHQGLPKPPLSRDRYRIVVHRTFLCQRHLCEPSSQRMSPCDVSACTPSAQRSWRRLTTPITGGAARLPPNAQALACSSQPSSDRPPRHGLLKFGYFHQEFAPTGPNVSACTPRPSASRDESITHIAQAVGTGPGAAGHAPGSTAALRPVPVFPVRPSRPRRAATGPWAPSAAGPRRPSDPSDPTPRPPRARSHPPERVPGRGRPITPKGSAHTSPTDQVRDDQP